MMIIASMIMATIIIMVILKSEIYRWILYIYFQGDVYGGHDNDDGDYIDDDEDGDKKNYGYDDDHDHDVPSEADW